MKRNQGSKIQDNGGATNVRPLPSYLQRLVTLVILLSVLASQSLFAADTSTTSEKAGEVVKETTLAVEKAGAAAAESAKTLWQRIDEARLKNRTPDEIVAWVIVGVLVGAVAGMMTPLKPTGLGKLGRLALGLAGSFLGGIVVHVGQFDFGWGPVLIRYEELFFSLIGAVLIVAVGRLIRSRMNKKAPSH